MPCRDYRDLSVSGDIFYCHDRGQCFWEAEARVAAKRDSPAKNYLAQMFSAELRSPVALVPVGSADLTLA